MMDVAPTLRRFTGRCPPGGLISLGAARREIVVPHAPPLRGSLPPGGVHFFLGRPGEKTAPTLRRCAGRCPPGGLISLGADRQEIVPAKRHRFASLRLGLISLGMALVTGCSSTPPTPDWQTNAQGALNSYSAAYLLGNSQVAEFEFARTRQEIASTGKLDLVARAEAVRCAVRLASLVLDDCAGFTPLQADAAAPERAYVAYLRAKTALNSEQRLLLPEQHRALVAAKDDGSRVATLNTMADPLARLIAAGVLFQQGFLPPAGVTIAVQTASDQGWRRPLLAWLGVQLKLAQAAGDAVAQASIQRRIDLVGPVKP